MDFKPRDAKFLSEQLKLPIDLKQQLERFSSRSGELSIDDIDRLLEICNKRLPEVKYDEKGNPTAAGIHLEKLIEQLRYA